MNFLRFFASVWPLLLLNGVIGNIGFVAACLAMHINIKEIALGCGPSFFSTDTRLGRVSLRDIPVGGFVGFDDDVAKQPSASQLLLINLTGSAIIMSASAACLGWRGAWDAFLSGFGQCLFFFKSSFFSTDLGVVLLKSFQAKLSVSWPLAYGTLAAKMTSFAWLPALASNGGPILNAWAQKLPIKKPEDLVLKVLGAVSFFVFVPWAMALIVFMFKA